MLNPPTREDDIFWTRLIFFGTLLIAIVWLTKTFVPLRHQIEEKEQLIGGIEAEARATLAEIQTFKQQRSEAVKRRGKVEASLPRYAAGSAILWLPKLTKEHFAGFKIPTGVIRLNATLADEKIPGINHVYVSVEVPIANPEAMKALLLAGAELERRNPLIRFADFIVYPNPLDPSTQAASLNLEALDRN